jgi:hypothetical protein
MRMHQVEVDDEVFALVKAHAEPLVDTFNSAVRRLLPMGSRVEHSKGAAALKPSVVDGTASLPIFPRGTPEALSQILEVVRLARGGAYTRTAATRFVAKRHEVFPQTVLDKYCRQLQLNANEFDRLLEQEDIAELRGLLRSKFPAHVDLIDQTLSAK